MVNDRLFRRPADLSGFRARSVDTLIAELAKRARQARLEESGWRVTERRADLTDIPIADFVSLRDAEEMGEVETRAPEVQSSCRVTLCCGTSVADQSRRFRLPPTISGLALKADSVTAGRYASSAPNLEISSHC